MILEKNAKYVKARKVWIPYMKRSYTVETEKLKDPELRFQGENKDSCDIGSEEKSTSFKDLGNSKFNFDN